jgi:signal transduction histidine kinase
MKRYSFRLRLLFALCFWTFGSFLLVHGISIGMLERFPWLANVSRGFGLFILAGGFLIIGTVMSFGKRGMASFDELRNSLTAVREGGAMRVEGDYPNEIQPLVDDLNTLLEHREEVVRRARAKAADLAHGLKTPLALLAREAENARGQGDAVAAAGISEQVERMRRLVEYQLAHARAAGSAALPGVRASVREGVDAIVRTLRRLYAEKPFRIDIDVDDGLTVRCQREDLEDMLGNLLDNAWKWGSSTTHVAAAQASGFVTIVVEDDGPGIDEGARERALRRGVRMDESAEGSGLGLAIVRDLAELYGGAISLGDSPLGGLRAQLTLPAA